MTTFTNNQRVKIKPEALPIIADQMALDLSHIADEIGILHASNESAWDWYFESGIEGNIPVLENEIEAVNK